MIKDILHLRAPGNWINDPNGFIFYKGKYHLFYQYFPYAPVWGTMHWGHGVSEDLIHWDHLGVALFPTKDYDRNGVFSGSALEKDGKMYVYYSAVRYLREQEENIHQAKDENFETSQAMIVSEDGIHFDNWQDKSQIIPVCHDSRIADNRHTRDPKVWKGKDWYYMVLGSTFQNKEARLLCYRSKDARNWEYASQFRSKKYGRVLECPDLFALGEKYVFIGSPMGIMEDKKCYKDQAVCTLADFQEDTGEIHLGDQYEFLDYGFDLYAPQSNLDKEGRRVMIAWMRMPKAVESKDRGAWNGIMCLPRVVEVENEKICFPVHPQVEEYFSGELASPKELDFEKPFCIKTFLQEDEEVNIGGYRIWVSGGCVRTDRSRVFAKEENRHMVCSTPVLEGPWELTVFVEPNLIEVFVNNGRYVISNVVYGLKKEISGRAEHIFVGSP